MSEPTTQFQRPPGNKPPKAINKAADVYSRLNSLPDRAMEGLPPELIREIRESKHARRLAFQLLTDLVLGPKRPCTRCVTISYDELLRLLWHPATEQRPQWKTEEEAQIWLRQNSPDPKDSLAIDRWWRDQRHLPIIHAIVRHTGERNIFFAALFDFSLATEIHDAKAHRKLDNQSGDITRRELSIELVRRGASAVKAGGAFTAFLWQVLAMHAELVRLTDRYSNEADIILRQTDQIADFNAKNVALQVENEKHSERILELETQLKQHGKELEQEQATRHLAVVHQNVAAQSAQSELLTELRRELLPRIQKIVEYTDRDIPNKDRILVLAKEIHDTLKKTDT